LIEGYELFYLGRRGCTGISVASDQMGSGQESTELKTETASGVCITNLPWFRELVADCPVDWVYKSQEFTSFNRFKLYRVFIKKWMSQNLKAWAARV
jgi:hypothetical protein